MTSSSTLAVPIGLGYSLPENCYSNEQIAEFIDTSDEWIRTRTGIGSRYLTDQETTLSMALEACQQALNNSGKTVEEIDLLVVATQTADYIMPSCSSALAHELGCHQAACFDLVVACSGFTYALYSASQMIEAQGFQTALVVGADSTSRLLNWEDRTTCVLFGDGAGAMLLEGRQDTQEGVLSHLCGADGTTGQALKFNAGGALLPHNAPQYQHQDYRVQMEGKKVFKFAVSTVPKGIEGVLQKIGMGIEEVDTFIFHQANQRITESACKRLSIPSEKVFSNIKQVGNTVAASVPLAFYQAYEKGVIQPGDTICTIGFGAGLAWCALVIRLPQQKLL